MGNPLLPGNLPWSSFFTWTPAATVTRKPVPTTLKTRCECTGNLTWPQVTRNLAVANLIRIPAANSSLPRGELYKQLPGTYCGTPEYPAKPFASTPGRTVWGTSKTCSKMLVDVLPNGANSPIDSTPPPPPLPSPPLPPRPRTDRGTARNCPPPAVLNFEER